MFACLLDILSPFPSAQTRGDLQHFVEHSHEDVTVACGSSNKQGMVKGYFTILGLWVKHWVVESLVKIVKALYIIRKLTCRNDECLARYRFATSSAVISLNNYNQQLTYCNVGEAHFAFRYIVNLESNAIVFQQPNMEPRRWTVAIIIPNGISNRLVFSEI